MVQRAGEVGQGEPPGIGTEGASQNVHGREQDEQERKNKERDNPDPFTPTIAGGTRFSRVPFLIS